MDSKSLSIIKALERETLEAALFIAVATLREIGKGELLPPPKTLDRTDLTLGLVNSGLAFLKKAKAEAEAEAEAEKVTDVTQAASLLQSISKAAK